MDNLDDAFDELYAASPDDFVAERSRLAKALKEGGRAEDAKTLAATRKPTVAAWALNQLARRNRREIDLLLDAGHRLREAQAGLLAAAEHEAFDRARETERSALLLLTREAEQLLRTRGNVSATVLNQINQSLRAAAISPEGRELLAQGRFSEPLSGEGFDLLSELAGSVRPPTPPRKPAPKQEQRRKLRQALQDAKSELRAAERVAAEADADSERLAAAAAQARQTAAAANDEVEAAASRVRAAEKRLADT